jgi:primase-polymerase (primpol)-like protein
VSAIYNNIPEELRALPQWAVWRREGIDPKTGKPRKPPYRVEHAHAHASSTDPATWTTFEQAVMAAENGFDGIAFALTADDEFAFVDLDGRSRWRRGQWRPPHRPPPPAQHIHGEEPVRFEGYMCWFEGS